VLNCVKQGYHRSAYLGLAHPPWEKCPAPERCRTLHLLGEQAILRYNESLPHVYEV